MKTIALAALLTALPLLAQSNPTTYTNNNLPNPEPLSSTYSFNIVTEDGQPIHGPCGNGCVIGISNNANLWLILPDINTPGWDLTCTITSMVVGSNYVTYTATGDFDHDWDDAPCKDDSGQMWKIVATLNFYWTQYNGHWVKYYTGGSGTMSH